MQLEDILSRAKKVAEEAEVFLVSAKETPVGFEANRLKMLETSESTFPWEVGEAWSFEQHLEKGRAFIRGDQEASIGG